MKKIFYITTAFLCLAFSISVFAQDETRAVAAWQVKKYDITVSTADRFLTAKAILNVQNVGTAAGSRLTLRISDKAEISAATVNGATANFTKGEEKLGTTRTLQRIIVSLPSVQPSGTASVTIDYKLKVEENSGLNGISPIGSQFLPLAFWYPTPNGFYAPRGADFAPFRLTVNSGDTIVSSGTQTGNSFEQKLNGQPFFTTGNWDTVEAKGVTVFLPKGASESEKQRAGELANLAVEAKTFVASLLGTVTETPTRIVAVKRGGGFADSGTILLDASAFRRQKIDSQTAMAIAEATAKIWLGNAAIVRGEGYGVIREGLSRYVANLFIEKQFGKEIADIERLRQRTAYAAVARREGSLNQISPLDDFYFSSVANKGAMIWRLTAKNIGQNEFFAVIAAKLKEGTLTLPALRNSFPSQKENLDFWFDQLNDVNLLVGLPRVEGAETKVALRNLGAVEANVSVNAVTEKGEKLNTQATIAAKSFGEASFKTTSKIVRVEIDQEKFYPQTDFSDDVAPREFNDSDALLIIKRSYDNRDEGKPNFTVAEKFARTILQSYPRFDDARTWLGRSLLAQNKTAEAEKEFRAVLDEKLPSARSLAWANLGLGEIAAKLNRNAEALKYFEEAIKTEGETGATLAARAGRNKISGASQVDESIRSFFTQFDKAAVSGVKANIENLIVSGEMTKFSGGIAGQAQSWQTQIVQTDKLDANNVYVEVFLNIKMLNREPESGTAIFCLSKVGTSWKLSNIEVFEVR